MATEKVYEKDKPFRVSHTNGDIVAGFSDLESAQEDAAERNTRAQSLGIRARMGILSQGSAT